MAEWFECVCQFLRQQSTSLASVMQNIGTQSTLSDIDTSSPDAITDHFSSHSAGVGGIAGLTPMHIFMTLLAVVYAVMFIQNQGKQPTLKPTNNSGGSGDREGGGNEGGGAGVA